MNAQCSAFLRVQDNPYRYHLANHLLFLHHCFLFTPFGLRPQGAWNTSWVFPITFDWTWIISKMFAPVICTRNCFCIQSCNRFMLKVKLNCWIWSHEWFVNNLKAIWDRRKWAYLITIMTFVYRCQVLLSSSLLASLTLEFYIFNHLKHSVLLYDAPPPPPAPKYLRNYRFWLTITRIIESH